MRTPWNIPLARRLWRGHRPTAEIIAATGATESQVTSYAYQHGWGRRTPRFVAAQWRCQAPACRQLNTAALCIGCGRPRLGQVLQEDA